MDFSKEEIEKQIISAMTIAELAYAGYHEKHFSHSPDVSSERNYVENNLEITISKVLELVKNNTVSLDYRFDSGLLKQLIKKDEYLKYTRDLARHSYMRKLCTAVERSVTFNENEPDFGCKDETIFSLLLKHVYTFDYSEELTSLLNSDLDYKVTNMGKSFVANILNVKTRVYYGSVEFREKLVRTILRSENVDDSFKMKLVSKLVSLNPSYDCNALATKICSGTYLNATSIKNADFSEPLHRSIITNQPVLSDLIINNLSYDPNYYYYEKKDNGTKIVTLLELILDPVFSNKAVLNKIINHDDFNIDSLDKENMSLYNKIFIKALEYNQHDFAFAWLRKFMSKFDNETIKSASNYIDTKKKSGIDECSEIATRMSDSFIEIAVHKNDAVLLDEVAEFEAQNDPYLAEDAREKKIYQLRKVVRILKDTLALANVPTVNDAIKCKRR